MNPSQEEYLRSSSLGTVNQNLQLSRSSTNFLASWMPLFLNNSLLKLSRQYLKIKPYRRIPPGRDTTMTSSWECSNLYLRSILNDLRRTDLTFWTCLQANRRLQKVNQLLNRKEIKFKLSTEGLLINSGTIREDLNSTRRKTTKTQSGLTSIQKRRAVPFSGEQ